MKNTKTRPNLPKFVKVKLKSDIPPEPNDFSLSNRMFEIENYCDVLNGGISWLDIDLEVMPIALFMYIQRKGFMFEINDYDVDWVVYGKIDGYGHCVHLKEIEGWEQFYDSL